MKKTFAALLAATAFVIAAPAAQADGGRVAAGVIGGLAVGALVGGALASSRPAYAAAAPVYVDVPCHMARERFWDGYEWRFRRVKVCR